MVTVPASRERRTALHPVIVEWRVGKANRSGQTPSQVTYYLLVWDSQGRYDGCVAVAMAMSSEI